MQVCFSGLGEGGGEERSVPPAQRGGGGEIKKVDDNYEKNHVTRLVLVFYLSELY